VAVQCSSESSSGIGSASNSAVPCVVWAGFIDALKAVSSKEITLGLHNNNNIEVRVLLAVYVVVIGVITAIIIRVVVKVVVAVVEVVLEMSCNSSNSSDGGSSDNSSSSHLV
jgi:hypothetical protein